MRLCTASRRMEFDSRIAILPSVVFRDHREPSRPDVVDYGRPRKLCWRACRHAGFSNRAVPPAARLSPPLMREAPRRRACRALLSPDEQLPIGAGTPDGGPGLGSSPNVRPVPSPAPRLISGPGIGSAWGNLVNWNVAFLPRAAGRPLGDVSMVFIFLPVMTRARIWPAANPRP